MAEEPFTPRRRWSSIRRELRSRSRAPPGYELVALALLAICVLSFWRMFVAIDMGGTGALAAGGRAIVWLMIAVGALALAGYALIVSRDPPALLRPDALRDELAAAWSRVRAR